MTNFYQVSDEYRQREADQRKRKQESKMKRGTRIEYTYALGKIVQGEIVREYPDLPGWFECEITDESGTYRVGCHVDQMRPPHPHGPTWRLL